MIMDARQKSGKPNDGRVAYKMKHVCSLVDKSEEFYDVERPDKQVVSVSAGEIGEVKGAWYLNYPSFSPVESMGKRMILWPRGLMLMELWEYEYIDEEEPVK